MVVLPGVSDDFYLIHRDAPPLNLRATNLFAAITALTNGTPVRVTWREPFVLLHVAKDSLEPMVRVEAAADASDLRGKRIPGLALHLDAHWETIQPALQRDLRRPVSPDGSSRDAWHFNRHNLAGWNLTGWEFLQALSLTGGTSVHVQKLGIFFHVPGIP